MSTYAAIKVQIAQSKVNFHDFICKNIKLKSNTLITVTFSSVDNSIALGYPILIGLEWNNYQVMLELIVQYNTAQNLKINTRITSN